MLIESKKVELIGYVAIASKLNISSWSMVQSPKRRMPMKLMRLGKPMKMDVTGEAGTATDSISSSTLQRKVPPGSCLQIV